MKFLKRRGIDWGKIFSVFAFAYIVLYCFRIYSLGNESNYVDCNVHTFEPKRVLISSEEDWAGLTKKNLNVYLVIYEAKDKSGYFVEKKFRKRSKAVEFFKTAKPVRRRIFEFKKDGKTKKYMDVDVWMTASDVLAQERWRCIPFMIFWGLYLLIYSSIKYVCYRKKIAKSKNAEKAFESKTQAKANNSGRYKERDSFTENSAANESVNVNAKVNVNENVGENDMNAENAHSQKTKASSSSKRYERKSSDHKRRDEYFARSKKDDGNELM